jgi:hypothetical protein
VKTTRNGRVYILLDSHKSLADNGLYIFVSHFDKQCFPGLIIRTKKDVDEIIKHYTPIKHGKCMKIVFPINKVME